MKKENEFNCLFGHDIISNDHIRINIMAKKTKELVLRFHKKISKLVVHWPNMGQLYFKVLRLVLSISISIKKFTLIQPIR